MHEQYKKKKIIKKALSKDTKFFNLVIKIENFIYN